MSHLKRLAWLIGLVALVSCADNGAPKSGSGPAATEACSSRDPEVAPHPLLVAAAEGKTDEIETLVHDGYSPNERVKTTYANTTFLRSPLLCAIENRQFSAAGKLLDLGADPNLPNHYGTSPLGDAISGDAADSGLLRVLLRHGADPNRANQGGYTALAYAVELGDIETTRILLEEGKGDPNQGQLMGSSLLQSAAESGSMSMTKLLIEHRADPRKVDLQLVDDPRIVSLIRSVATR